MCRLSKGPIEDGFQLVKVKYRSLVVHLLWNCPLVSHTAYEQFGNNFLFQRTLNVGIVCAKCSTKPVKETKGESDRGGVGYLQDLHWVTSTASCANKIELFGIS
mgnify:FL=1